MDTAGDTESSPNRESQRLRKRLREAENQLTEAATRLEALQRQVVVDDGAGNVSAAPSLGGLEPSIGRQVTRIVG